MVNKETIINVTNRSNGTVGYYVQDLAIRRDFNFKETKEIPFEELWKLSQQPGGKSLIQKCLVFDNQEAVTQILGAVEPEYFYTEEDIKKLLISGTVEQLIDCLNFAPDGVKDLVKTLSVDLELNDIKKREVILEKTGFNVTKAIEINKETDNGQEESTEGSRLSTPIINRQAEAPKYKVTSIQE